MTTSKYGIGGKKGMDEKDDKVKENVPIVNSVVLSIFDDDGPTPAVFWPYNMDEASRLLIAMKTISLLMGDSVYQNGIGVDGINYFGVLPFPDLGLNGLTYFFLIADEEARGQAKAATITVLIDENNNTFFYENMKYLRVIIDKTASKIQESEGLDDYKIIMDSLKDELIEFAKDLKDPLSTKRKIKILYTGLDGAGKTSFLLAIRKKYSEIVKTLPTKGVNRSEEKLFSEQNSQISIWDLGGQRKYRRRYLEQSKIYLYNVDLLFYLIDIQDTTRIEESIKLFEDIIENLKELDEFPPIIVCLNKFDPDLTTSEEILANVRKVSQEIEKLSDKFVAKIFKTSIFDQWSLISAYSFGLSQLSPNRELFRKQLEQFANKTNSESLLLLNGNGIILSSYSKDTVAGKVFEISAPHFQTLYKTFKEFKLLEKDFIVSSGITDEAKTIIFKKIKVNKYHLYLLFFMDQCDCMDVIDTHLPAFSEKLVELIKTYI